MEQKKIIGIFAVTMIFFLGVGFISAFGFGEGKMNFNLNEEDREEMQENREAIQTAIEEEDFESWKSLMEEKIAKMQEQITEENFNSIVERHSEMVEMREKMDEAREEFCEEHECPGGERFQRNMEFGMHLNQNID